MAAGNLAARVVWRLEAENVPDIVSCHSFSPNRQTLAICPNSEDVVIFQRQGNEEFQRSCTLSKHTHRVTALDWSCEGRLLSCSEDRTAWVYDPDPTAPSGWRPCEVTLKVKNAALCAAWAPNGMRFAIGFASKETALCYYEPMVQCWVSLKVGRYKNSVTTLAWHPESQFLATGSTDRRWSVYAVDEANMPSATEASKGSFGEEQIRETANAWINQVAFSPNGRILAIISQDSTVRMKNLSAGKDSPVAVVRWRSLPFVCGAFVNDKCLVCCGYDMVPVLIRNVSGNWEVSGMVDTGPVAAPSAGAGGSAFDAARSKFRESSGRKTQTALEGPGAASGKEHSNTITACNPFGATLFTTSGLDGQVLIWELTTA